MQMRSQIVVCIPCLLLGGSELATLSLVRALAAAAYHVTVCCYYESDAAMVRRFEQAGVRVKLLGMSRGNLRDLFSALVQYLRAQRPDIVHVQYFAPGMIPILAARRAGVKHVFATVHAAGQNGYGWKAKAMLRFSALFTDHFFCVSQNAERFWFGSTLDVGRSINGSKARHSTIYNCVDVARIQDTQKVDGREALCPGLSPRAKVIGIVGRLVRLKGHFTLLRAMKDILAVVPDVVLLVIGEGADEDVFRREAERLGVASHVIWKGRVEPEVLPQYYHIMDVLAMPSHWEGFGLTAAEAMAAGTPVVGTDVPGLREVVEEGATGSLVPVEDANALAERLLHLLQNDSERQKLGLAGLDRVRRLFNVDVIGGRWLDAYASLLGADDRSMAASGNVSSE